MGFSSPSFTTHPLVATEPNPFQPVPTTPGSNALHPISTVPSTSLQEYIIRDALLDFGFPHRFVLRAKFASSPRRNYAVCYHDKCGIQTGRCRSLFA
ncbi:hypothetical protein M404DRAFT_998179, partial [Pisolithus tinctorius Marx 270]